MAESLDGSARSGSKEFLLRKTQEQSLGIARTLWREGLVHLSPFSTRDEPIVSDMFSCYESCLSPAVRALLGRPLPPVSGEEGDTFINFGLTLNWDKVETHFAKVDPELADCSLGATAVAEIAASTTPLLALSATEYLSRGSFAERVSWTGHTQEFVESLEHLTCAARSRGSPAALLSLLLSTACLERALGDVYLYVSGSDRCPALLKDLLGQKELVEVFGALPVYLVRCLMGPPTSLNLRNLVWHGFVAPTELHPEYAALMLVLVGSLGELLGRQKGRAVGRGVVHHRPPVDLCEPTRLLEEVTAGFSPNSASLKLLLPKCVLVLPSRRTVWSAALDHWTQGRYGYFLVLILPELETSLRLVFACCNSCPHRTLTAETSTLFTTFDEILSPVVPGGGAAVGVEQNQLVQELGRPIMEMLLDLLVHTQGLRLRDRISHGELDLLACPKELATFVLFVTAVLCHKYSCPATEELALNDKVHKYQSIFHPATALKREVLCVLEVLSQWDDIKVPQEWPTEGRGQECAEGRGQVVSSTHGLEQCVTDMMDWAEEGGSCPSVDTVRRVWSGMETLFLPRCQMELIVVLQQLTSNCLKALEQVCVTARERYTQFCDKVLRSRQRENYQRLLNSLPTFRTAGYFCVAAVLLQAAHLSRPEEATRRAIKALKRLLSLMENLQSQTSATRNQWSEASQLCHSLLPQLTDRLRQTHMRTERPPYSTS